MNFISIMNDDIDSINVTIGDVTKHAVGTLDQIGFKKDLSEECLSIYRIIFLDKIYDTFNIEIKYKSGNIITLGNFSIVEKTNAFCCERFYILENIVVLKNIIKVNNVGHDGEIYNPYNDSWSWI